MVVGRASAALRRAMIEEIQSKVSSRDQIQNSRVKTALMSVPRELFVGDFMRTNGLEAVYRDDVIPLKRDSRGAVISSSSQPAIMIPMLDRLDLMPGHRVLEVGTGSGYNAALLSKIVGPKGRITSIDIDPDLARDARRALKKGGYRARVVVGDGRRGWPKDAPYDRIILTASSDRIPRPLFRQTEIGGLLEMPLQLDESGGLGRQMVVVFRKTKESLESTRVFPGGFMYLRSSSEEDAPGRTDYLLAGESWNGKWNSFQQVWGPAVLKMSQKRRRKLLSVLMSEGNSIPLRMNARWDSLAIFLTLALPKERWLMAGPWRPGIIVGSDSLALVGGGKRGIDRVVSFGDRSAARRLQRYISEWVDLGRPSVGSLRIRAGFGTPPSKSWRLTLRAPGWISFDW